MGFLKGAGKLAKGLAKVGGKAALKSADLLAKGAGAVYDNRESIAKAATAGAKLAGKTALAAGRMAYGGLTLQPTYFKQGVRA